jgi:hypothetical protein
MSGNSEATVRSGVFYMVQREAATLQWNTWCHIAHVNRGSVFCAAMLRLCNAVESLP